MVATVAMKVVMAQTLPPVTYETLLEQYVNRAFYFLLAASFAHFIESHVEAGIAVYVPGFGKLLVEDESTALDRKAAQLLEGDLWHCHGPLCEYDLLAMRLWFALWLLYNVYMISHARKKMSNDVRMIRTLGLGKSGSAGTSWARRFQGTDNDSTDVQKLVEEAENMSQAKAKAKPEAKDENVESETESDTEEAEE